MHTVIFYNKQKNTVSPIVSFLDACPTKTRVKILRQLQYVQEFGLVHVIPNIKKIAGTPLWELRILGRDNIRIFCVSVQKKVYVVHIFKKKQQKTPRKDMRLAQKRAEELLTNNI